MRCAAADAKDALEQRWRAAALKDVNLAALDVAARVNVARTASAVLTKRAVAHARARQPELALLAGTSSTPFDISRGDSVDQKDSPCLPGHFGRIAHLL